MFSSERCWKGVYLFRRVSIFPRGKKGLDNASSKSGPSGLKVRSHISGAKLAGVNGPHSKVHY
jgi:hypothetical protein